MSQPNDEQGRAFRGQVSAADLVNWLTQFLAAPRAALYAQHPLKRGEEGVCIAAALPANFTLTDWEQGRVFNDEFELRWHMHGDMVDLLLLTEQDDMPAACAQLCEWQATDGEYDVASTQHLLVGTFYRRQDGSWFFAKAGVPRKFKYPVNIAGLKNDDRAHAILHGKHYRRGSRTVLTRFTHFRIKRERREGGEQQ